MGKEKETIWKDGIAIATHKKERHTDQIHLLQSTLWSLELNCYTELQRLIGTDSTMRKGNSSHLKG